MRQLHHRNSQGFTLFEILVVLVVVALAGSALVFGFGQTLARQKDAAAEQFLVWLQAVADTAVFQSTHLSNHIDHSSHFISK